MPPRALEPKQLGPWARGVNNVRRRTSLHRNELWASVNVDLTARGEPRRRRGRFKVFSGTNTHSLWQSSRYTFVVDDGRLKVFHDDYSATTITTLVDGMTYMEYAEINADVYFMNGTDSGIVKAGTLALRPLGLPRPGAPTLSTTSGALPQGSYLVGTAYVAPDGEISGMSDLVKIDLNGSQGLLVQDMLPPPAGYIADTLLYVSKPDGRETYLTVTVAQGTTSFAFTSAPAMTVQSETDLMDKIPAGAVCREYNGRLYVARGKFLYWSEPLMYGLHREEDNYLEFNEDIRVMEPAGNGIYVVTDETVFLRGKDMMDPEVINASDNTASKGSGMQAPGHWFKTRDPLPDRVAFWYSSKGAVLGSADGQLIRVMEGVAEDSEYAGGRSFATEHLGMRQVGTVLRGPDNASGLRMTESYTAEVRRNGVVISSD